MNYFFRASCIYMGIFYSLVSFSYADIITLNFAESSVSRFGNLTIKHSNESGDKLYLNSTPIDLGREGNSYTLALLDKVNFAQSEAYIVLGGSGGTMDMDSNIQCKVVQVSSVKQYTVSVLTYCPVFNSSSLSLESGMLLAKFSNSASYAESTDFGIWQFDPSSNRIKIIQKLKSEAYYKHKFANYTSAQIYQEARQDGNIDPTTKLVSACHICGMYGQKYCFKFQSLANPVHDSYYELLQKSCAN